MINLTAGNKSKFVMFTAVVICILTILCIAVILVLRTNKEEYSVANTVSIYDKDYNYIELASDAKISKKWTGNYYLKEDTSKKEYNLGNYAVSFDKNRKSLELFGNFYQVQKGGAINKITNHNTINNTNESQFYKIDDRKYLIVAKNIVNNTGSLSTENYLMVIIDKLGNALLLNNEINAKTINEMIISTDEFSFDVANESLVYDNEKIDLKKIIGSTNEHVKQEKENETTNQQNTTSTEIARTEGQGGTTTASSSKENETTNQKTQSPSTSTTTVVQQNNNNNVNSESKGNSGTQDTSWTDSLNGWIQKVAAGFQNIYNGNSGKKNNKELEKSISLNNLSAGTTYMDINYKVTDPEGKYNVVYAIVSDGAKSYNIALDKNGTSYRIEGLTPSTNYSVQIGYKVIYADSRVEEQVEDTMTIRTATPSEKLVITKVSTNELYYNLNLDRNFVYDSGAKLVMYLNDNKYTETELTSEQLERAASTGYVGKFTIPKEYKMKNSTIKIQLEYTKYSGTEVDSNLATKIVNY